MKLFLQNLLIFFALALCALISYQWVRETDLRKDLQKKTDLIQDKTEAIQNLEASLDTSKKESQRLYTLKNQLTEQIKSNNFEITSLSRALEKGTNELERTKEQVDLYKSRLEQANESIKKQNDDIKKQNEDVQKMVQERNEVVSNYNRTINEFNDLAQKWNKQQEELRKAATNAAAAKK